MRYSVVFEMAEGKNLQSHLSQSSEGGPRKRPESSSPSKIKARNQNKMGEMAGNEEGEDDEHYDNDEFEKLLDKDDEDDD